MSSGTTIFYRRTIPLMLTFIVGVVIAASWFITEPSNTLSTTATTFNSWVSVVMNWSMILAVCTHVVHHSRNMMQQSSQRKFGMSLMQSLIIFVSIISMVLIAFGVSTTGPTYQWIVTYVITVIEYTLGCTLALFVVIAYFRSWKTRPVELIFVSVLCAIGLLSTHPTVLSVFPQITPSLNWVILYLYPAAMRGFYIIAGTAGIILGIRVLTGLERGWLG